MKIPKYLYYVYAKYSGLDQLQLVGNIEACWTKKAAETIAARLDSPNAKHIVRRLPLMEAPPLTV
jgi:hypothetical protein